MQTRTLGIPNSEQVRNYGFGDGWYTYYVDCVFCDDTSTDKIENASYFINLNGERVYPNADNERIANSDYNIICPTGCVYYLNDKGKRAYSDYEGCQFIYGEFSDRSHKFKTVGVLGTDNLVYIYDNDNKLWWSDSLPKLYNSWVGVGEAGRFVYINSRVRELDSANNIRDSYKQWHGLDVNCFELRGIVDPDEFYFQSNGVPIAPLNGYYIINPSDKRRVYLGWFSKRGRIELSDENAGFDPKGDENAKLNHYGRIPAVWDDELQTYVEI